VLFRAKASVSQGKNGGPFAKPLYAHAFQLIFTSEGHVPYMHFFPLFFSFIASKVHGLAEGA
jgi:hypothetical protein